MRYLRELVRRRDLLFWLAVKEIKVRYKSPALGVLWALLVPLAISGILWVVFTYVLPVRPSAEVPFFLFLIAAMFPWHFFSQTVSAAPMSVLESGPLIKKHAFPRAVIPLAIVASNLFNFLMALLVVVAIVWLAGFAPAGRPGWLVLAVGLQVILTTGLALLVAGLQVQFRDVKFLTDVGLLLWFYLTPIFYPLSLVLQGPPVLVGCYLLNPMVWIVELYRIALFGVSSAPLVSWPLAAAWAAVSSVAAALVGLAVFRRQEASFADVVLG